MKTIFWLLPIILTAGACGEKKPPGLPPQTGQIINAQVGTAQAKGGAIKMFFIPKSPFSPTPGFVVTSPPEEKTNITAHLELPDVPDLKSIAAQTWQVRGKATIKIPGGNIPGGKGDLVLTRMKLEVTFLSPKEGVPRARVSITGGEDKESVALLLTGPITTLDGRAKTLR